MFYQRFALVILLIAIQLENVENRITLEMSSFICKNYAKDYLNITECAMKSINRDVTEITIYCQLFKKPLNNITLHADIRKYGSSNNRPLLGFKIDCCDFFKNKRLQPATQFFYTLLGFEKYSNMNHTCPYGYHDIIVDKWRLNENHLKLLPIVAGDYALHTVWSLYNKPAVELFLRFKIFGKK